MIVQPVNQNVKEFAGSYKPDSPGYLKPDSLLNEKQSRRPAVGGNAQTVLSSTYYSSDKLLLEYMNNDGDSVTLSMEHVEYQKAMLAVDVDAEYWKDIVDKVKEEYLLLKENIIKKIIASLEGEDGEQKAQKVESEEIKGLPEYWNEENTSQRIVDFATSFYGLTQCGGKEYYEMMRGAIEEGFNQAMGILGELPDAVNSLANRTYELALQKLEAWAVDMGIDVGEQSNVAA